MMYDSDLWGSWWVVRWLDDGTGARNSLRRKFLTFSTYGVY